MRLVVDASAILRLLEEAEREGAAGPVSRELLEWHNVSDVAAPDVLAYELVNVVHRKWAQRNEGDPEVRRRLVEDALAFVDLLPPDRAAVARIGAITESLGLTAYDAAYVELADRDVDSVLVTEDKVLARQAAALLGKERVFALGERFARA